MVSLNDILQAKKTLEGIVVNTPLQKNNRFSEQYNCSIYLKREDLQHVRSYKIRGSYNLISRLSEEEKLKGIIAVSAGNHAQGVAYSCKLLGVKGKIFMPATTPKQKISRTKTLGNSGVEIQLEGDTFDDACQRAIEYAHKQGSTFIHPFDDERIIAGQGTVGLEIIEELQPDIIVVPIGGGGLIAGLSIAVKENYPNVKIIGVEPEGAAAMKASFDNKKVVTLDTIDKFVDGAAVKRVGNITYNITKQYVDKIITVSTGKICMEMLQLYSEEGIIAEPAGALSISALDQLDLFQKKVVCIVSGGNNDIDRLPEIKERSLIYQGLKHYFLIRFAQRPGALREFLNFALGPNDDITRFEYIKKTDKESGPALVGIELSNKMDYLPLIERMSEQGIKYEEVKKDSMIYELFI